jgi:geranylgeranyl pyrophosphate synthase
MLYTTIDLNYRQSHFANAAQMIKTPSDYLSSLPSKGMRNTAIDALNVWYDVPPKFTAHISSVLHGLHTSSLMLDDIEDNSPLRRGKPATHCVFGIAQTINSANFQFAETLNIVRKELGSECLGVYAEELRLLHIGQSLDLHWTSQVKCPSMAEYMKMIDCSESDVVIPSTQRSS